LCRDLTIVNHLPPGVWKWIRKSQFWFPLVNPQSFLYFFVKIWWDSDKWPQSFRLKNLYCTEGIKNATILESVKWPLFNMLAFPNGFDYRNFDSKTFNCNIFSTYCANLFRLVQYSRDYKGKNCTFWQNGKNRHFVPNISAYTGLITTTFSLLIERCILIIKLK